MISRHWILGFILGDTTLSDLRFADDLLIFANSLDDLATMLDLLIAHLGEAGLKLNANKTNILSTITLQDQYVTLQSGIRIDILTRDEAHRWLGRQLCFGRGKTYQLETSSRSIAAIRAFNAKRSILCNQQIPLSARLRYFDALISQVFLFGSSCRAWAERELVQATVLCRKLLR